MASPFRGLFIHVNFILEYNWGEKIKNLFKGRHNKQTRQARRIRAASNEADGGGAARHSHRSACFLLRHHGLFLHVSTFILFHIHYPIHSIVLHLLYIHSRVHYSLSPSLLHPSFSRSSSTADKCIIQTLTFFMHSSSTPPNVDSPSPPIRVHHLLLFGITRGLHTFVDERI